MKSISSFRNRTAIILTVLVILFFVMFAISDPRTGHNIFDLYLPWVLGGLLLIVFILEMIKRLFRQKGE